MSKLPVSAEVAQLLNQFAAMPDAFVTPPTLVGEDIKAQFVDGIATATFDFTSAGTTNAKVRKEGANLGKNVAAVTPKVTIGDAVTTNMRIPVGDALKIINSGVATWKVSYKLSEPDGAGRRYDNFSVVSPVGVPANAPIAAPVAA